MMPQFQIRKTYEEVAEYLKQQIITGVYRPGDRLPSLRQLGEMLGVGQSTVREAVGSLKTMGLVSIRQGEGTFVTRFNPEQILSSFEAMQPATEQDILDLLEVRKIIEAGVVKLAAERRTDDDLRQIEQALLAMEQALTDGRLGEEADFSFHYCLALASKNPMLQSVMQSMEETMRKTLKASREKLFRKPGNAERLLSEHQQIYTAIANRNTSQAEQAMLFHINGVAEEIVKV